MPAFKLVAQQGMTRRQWEESLQWMYDKHKMPLLPPKEREIVLNYLEATYPAARARGSRRLAKSIRAEIEHDPDGTGFRSCAHEKATPLYVPRTARSKQPRIPGTRLASRSIEKAARGISALVKMRSHIAVAM